VSTASPAQLEAPSPARRAWALASLAALFILTFLLAALPAVGGSRVVLASVGGSPDWLTGIFRPLGLPGLSGENAGWIYYPLLMLAALLWGVVCHLADSLDLRVLAWSVGGLIAICFLAPPLLSQDVFSYIAYSRLGVVHDLNPYAYRPFDIPHDPVFGYAGSKDAVNVYGPFFTLGSYPLAWLPVPAAFWFFKLLAAGCVAGILHLSDGIAQRVGASRTRALALVGLSPAVLLHVVTAAHNEALTMLIVIAGVALAVSRTDGSRESAGGFVSTLAIGVKASAAVPLVFMLAAAKKKSSMFIAMAAAGLLTAATAVIGFGSHALGGMNLISSNQDRSSSWSLPHKTVDGIEQLFTGVSRDGATDIVRLIFVLLLAALVIYLLWRSWKQPETWLANAGWATLGVLLATAWLVPWYLLWLLPFAALGRDHRLQVASVIFCAYTLVIAVPFS
jgi:alpha-1,6-mannosyltransferase